MTPRQTAASESEAWYANGMILAERRRLGEAPASFDTALALTPTFERAWAGKRLVLFELRRVAKAIHCQDRALGLDPTDAAVWSEKALCLLELDRFEEALTLHDGALQINSRAADCWGNRGIAGKARGSTQSVNASNEAKSLVKTVGGSTEIGLAQDKGLPRPSGMAKRGAKLGTKPICAFESTNRLCYLFLTQALSPWRSALNEATGW